MEDRVSCLLLRMSGLYHYLVQVSVGDFSGLNFVGIMAEKKPEIVDIYPPPSRRIPLLRTLSKFVLPESVEIVSLDAIIAARRFFGSPTRSPPEIFMFTIQRQSVSPESSGICFCYVLRYTEMVPASNGRCFIVPSALVLIADDPCIDMYQEILIRWHTARFDKLKRFWTGQTDSGSELKFYAWLASVSTRENFPNLDLYLISWFFIPIFRFSKEILLKLFSCLVAERKVMVVSESVSKRSGGVLGLFALMELTRLKWPHPCLAAPPEDIAAELPNAPTPMIAGLVEVPIGTSRGVVLVNLDSQSVEMEDDFPVLTIENEEVDVEILSKQAWVGNQVVKSGGVADTVREQLEFLGRLKCKVDKVVRAVEESLRGSSGDFKSDLESVSSIFGHNSFESFVFSSQLFHIQKS